jgi:beta-RFAP synthase
MIEAPGIELLAEPAPRWSFDGPLAGRVEAALRHIQVQSPQSLNLHRVAPARLHVLTTPLDHVGLGVGTQLSLAVVRIVLKLAGAKEPSVETLAELSGRGQRSGIGLHGFMSGGLIVDGGRSEDSKPPPLITRMSFPVEWSILIIQPPGPRGRHGPEELQAFGELPPLPDRVTERLCRLVLLGILPAVAERDLQAFGQAVSELQHHVGSAFAPLQGGLYASADSESVIAELGNLGLVGAGQSSWGPTIYAFGALTAQDRQTIAFRILERSGLRPSAILWTHAANRGAILDLIK